jgi:hypothetical protein
MKKIKFQPSSDVPANFDIGNEGLRFNALLKKKIKNGPPRDLNHKLTVLHAAHKGLHPVIFTVLAALRDVMHNQEPITHHSQRT